MTFTIPLKNRDRAFQKARQFLNQQMLRALMIPAELLDDSKSRTRFLLCRRKP